MITQKRGELVRVTVTLEAVDVALLDKLAGFEGENRSAELRGLLQQVRPTLEQLVAIFESATKQREALDQAMVGATVSELEAILPEVEEINRRFMGAMAKLEGTATANAPASNTGATS